MWHFMRRRYCFGKWLEDAIRFDGTVVLRVYVRDAVHMEEHLV